ncbi:MAG: hypothetical protein ACOYN4_22130 [Bacteroidales bacterium]
MGTNNQTSENETSEKTYKVEVSQMEGHCLSSLINAAFEFCGSLGNNPSIMIEMLQLFNENNSNDGEFSKRKRENAYSLVSHFLTYSKIVVNYENEIPDLDTTLENLRKTF